MTRELRIDTWCDPCLAKGAHEEATTEEVALGGRTLQLDVCKAHRDKLIAPLETALEAWGRRPEKAPRKTSATRPLAPSLDMAPLPQCLVCGHQTPTSSALGAHIRTHHDMNMAQMFGDACPLCGATMGAPGLGQHMNRAHDVTGGMGVAFLVARAQGDPHGVVARQDALMLNG